jgi:cation diffusion facilitator family transporter
VSDARRRLIRFAWLSIAAAISTMVIKAVAYLLTGSVGLLSDALESSVNLVAAIGALVALTVAAKPADDQHAYGHDKAEYFSALAEGVMIIVAAGTIAYSAFRRLIDPQPLESVGIGLAITAVATAVNLVVATILVRTGRQHRSITLEADGRHLFTDVWTSLGVIVGVAVVGLTGIDRLDPLIAMAVAVNIVVSGVAIIRRSTRGLMDAALPAADQEAITQVLERHRSATVQFHGLRTRQSGRRAFMSVHVLVPGAWTIQQGHDLAEEIEAELDDRIADLTVTTHLEPLEDPRSFADEDLDRRSVPPSASEGLRRPGSTGES